MRGWLSRPAARDGLLLAALLACTALQVAVDPLPRATVAWALLTLAPLAVRSWSPVVAGLGCQLLFVLGTPVVVRAEGAEADVLAQGEKL